MGMQTVLIKKGYHQLSPNSSSYVRTATNDDRRRWQRLARPAKHNNCDRSCCGWCGFWRYVRRHAVLSLLPYLSSFPTPLDALVLLYRFSGVTRLVAAPLDLLKIRFQVQPTLSAPTQHLQLKYVGLLQAVRSIYAEEGLRTFWRGNLAATGLWVGYSSLQFATYRTLTRYWEHSQDGVLAAAPPFQVSAVNGAVAGVTAAVVTYPLDLFRTAFASQGMPKRFPTIRSLALHIWTTQGARGFFSGLGATTLQIAPYMGLTFSIYSTLNEVALKHRRKQEGGTVSAWTPLSNALSYVGSGAVAGLVSKLIVYPLDTVKKCMQMRYVPRSTAYGVIPTYSSSWRCFVDVLQREGVRGLYKGTVPSLLKSVVSASATFASYELMLEVLRHVPIHRDSKEWTEDRNVDGE